MLPFIALSAIPTQIYVQNDQRAIVPDWSRLSFERLPRFAQSGAILQSPAADFIGPPAALKQWQAGEAVEQVVTLGDFQDSFKLQEYDLYGILIAAKIVPTEVPLSNFRLIQQQTIHSLTDAIPSLDNLPIAQIPPVRDLLSATIDAQTLSTLTLHQLLAQSPPVGELTFTTLDLSRYHLTDIPGLLNAPLQGFKHWQQAKIAEIPGLRSVAWSLFPNPPLMNGTIATLQAPSQVGTNFVSLKHRNGDAQWKAGSQTVNGGQGEWRGSEPDGRKPFGSAFKLVVDQITPTQIQTSIYFRTCESHASVAINCSPYTVGAIPFLTVHRGDAILVESQIEVPTMPQFSKVRDSDPSVVVAALPSKSHGLWDSILNQAAQTWNWVKSHCPVIEQDTKNKG